METVRPLRDTEFDAAIDVLRRAGFGVTVAPLVAYPHTSPDGHVLAIGRPWRAPVGVVCCASFGASGWIGALAVAPEARGRGHGTALTRAAVDWLRGRGARTVSLYATPAGRPIYERIGFVPEGPSTAWRGTAGVRRGVDIVRLGEAQRAAMGALDRAATGEDRSPVLEALRPLNGLVAARNGEPTGFAVASPWGSGAAILAADDAAGLALMAATTAAYRPGTLIVPDANAAAAEALRHWGFQRFNTAERMRLGEPLAWRPERQFGQFNLFWG